MIRLEAMADCSLVTCTLVPELDPDDRILMRALQRRGLDVSIEIWSDPDVDWSSTSLCILRSTWDYHVRVYDFIAWIDRAAGLTRVKNDPRLVKWNADKSYLRDLEARGVPIVPTAWVRRGQRLSLADLSENRGWHQIVLKPSKGAAGHGVSLVRPHSASAAAAQAQLDRLAQEQDVLVQPYLEDVQAYGERALIFLDGRYSHAVVKKPFDTVLAISDAESSLVEATPEEVAVATRALEAVPGETLYARVDLLRDDSQNARVSEVELIEPALYLAVRESAGQTFADAVERRLQTVTEAIS
jgi:glutathione synthase/RimK-type ligase-like ATP-grasp enzyme